MRKIAGLTILLASVVAMVTLAGCTGANADVKVAATACPTTNADINTNADVPWEEGVITYISSEGGFYGIVTHDGKRYEPANLSKEFQHEGWPVLLKTKALDVQATHNWGTPVEIISMLFET